MIRQFVASAFVVLAGAASLIGCAADRDRASSPEGRWTVTEIAGAPVAAPGRTTLEIAADGKVGGKGGCNSYFSSATIGDKTIAFGPVGSTKMACDEPAMSQEMAYFDALASVTGWRIDDGTLALLDIDGTTMVRLTAAD